MALCFACFAQWAPAARAGLSANVLAQDPPATLQWQRIDDMPIGVFNAAVSVQHDLPSDEAAARGDDGDDTSGKREPARAVVVGGLTQAGQASPIVQVLDLQTLTWTTPLKMPQGVCEHTQVTLADGRIFIAGGRTGSLLDKLQTSRSTWLISADLKQVAAGPDLPAPSTNLTSHLLPDGRVMVIAGSNASIYDPASNDWAAHIALRQRRSSHTSQCLPDGRVLVAGGTGRNSVELVDPSQRISMMLAAQLDGPRDDLASALLPDGRVLLLGGQHTRTGLTTDEVVSVDLSNPRKAVIQKQQPLGIAHGAADLSITSLGPWVIALGGESQTDGGDIELTDARIIDGHTLQMWSLPQMLVEHDDAVSVGVGRAVIVIGGYAVNEVKLGPLQTRVPTAVHVVERLMLPLEKMQPR